MRAIQMLRFEEYGRFGTGPDLAEIGRLTMYFATLEAEVALCCETLLLRPERLPDHLVTSFCDEALRVIASIPPFQGWARSHTSRLSFPIPRQKHQKAPGYTAPVQAESGSGTQRGLT
jgi:hypothetical protein